MTRLHELHDDAPMLTTRQREVVEHALDVGYFEWPRRTSSEELAADLGVTRATCLEHLRKAEEKLLRHALDKEDEDDTLPGMSYVRAARS